MPPSVEQYTVLVFDFFGKLTTINFEEMQELSRCDLDDPLFSSLPVNQKP